MFNTVAHSVFTMLCNHHLYLVPKCVIRPKGSPSPVKQLLPLPLLPLSLPLPRSQPLITTSLLPISIDLPILCISHKWNHTVHDPWCLASFTQCNVSKVHLCCSMCQYFTPFYGWVIFHHMHMPQFVYPFTCWRTFGFFPPFSYCG